MKKNKIRIAKIPAPERMAFVCVNAAGLYAVYSSDGQLSMSKEKNDASRFTFKNSDRNLDLTCTMLDRVINEYVPVAVYSVCHLMNDSTFLLKIA